jgi:hypothetical protein
MRVKLSKIAAGWTKIFIGERGGTRTLDPMIIHRRELRLDFNWHNWHIGCEQSVALIVRRAGASSARCSALASPRNVQRADAIPSVRL